MKSAEEKQATRRAYMKKYHAANKLREQEKRKVRYAANPEKYIAQQRRYYYGVSPKEGAALWEAQGRVCAICRTDSPGNSGTWNLDHDHTTGAVREFLCRACNVGLGLFKDDDCRLHLAAEYLRKHRRQEIKK